VRPVLDPAGALRHPSSPRRYEIDITAGIEGSTLWIGFRYGRQRFERATIERLGRAVQQSLGAIAAHCRTEGGYTPSDFPLTTLSQENLDELVASLELEAKG
jgi:non-ribosomal peptide synthase protein (TIGR01720 family)